MNRTIIALGALSFGLNASSAEADDGVLRAKPGLMELSLKAGGHFPQVSNKLQTSFDAAVKFGYGVALERRLQVFIELGYSQPSYKVKDTDGRLGTSGEDYVSTIKVRDLGLTLGGAYFIPVPVPLLLPYAGAGLQLHFVRSVVQGAGAMSFGRTDETVTKVGGVLFGGTGFKVGPGLLLGELRFGYTPISQKVTGPANIGHLSVLLGYGIMF